jgi:Tfp pilus tip-associated adhesin PilY1
MRSIFIPLILGFLLSLPVFAKGPPPGTGVGDVKANIMIMLDDSGSMNARDPTPGLSYCTYAVDVANNGDIFTVDPCYHRANRLDSSFKIKATIGGSYSQYNNNGSGNATFRQPWSLALDHDDSTDEFVFIGSREVRGRGSFSGRSTMSKVCTGITTTAACPKAGKLVATNTYIDNQNYTMGIAVQGNYVYTRTYNKTYLYKYNKSDLSLVTKRTNIFQDMGSYNYNYDGIAAVGDYVYLNSYNRRKICRYNASNLSNANFSNGQHCITSPSYYWRGLAASGKTTASTADDYLYSWAHNNRSGTINKFNANSGAFDSRFARRGTSSGQTYNIYRGIGIDPNDNVYLPEAGNTNRTYISKFNSSNTYVTRGPKQSNQGNRMQVAHTAIRAILKDPDLTAGANFGIMSWGTKFNIRTKISAQGANEILNKTLKKIRPNGGTELGKALKIVRTTYWHKAGATPIDLGAKCQGNFNLIVSDGQYWGSPTPEQQMPILSKHTTMPVKSFIVGLGNSIFGSNKYITLATAKYGDTTPPGALFANNVQSLTLQLRSAILAAISGNLTFTSPKVDFSSTPNGYICQPSFKYKEEDQWQGLLTRYEVKQDGSIDDPQGTNPNKTIRFHQKLDHRSSLATDTAGRKVWTVDNDIENPTSGTYKNNNFDPEYTVNSQNLVDVSTKNLMVGGNTHLGSRDVARIMKFMRGQDMFDQDSDCSTNTKAISFTARCYTEDKGSSDAKLLYKLHDLYNSTPAYVGAPSAVASPDVKGTENEYRYLNNYNAFKNAKKDRKNVLLIGSNGGMLHAFDNGCQIASASCAIPSNPGAELWAFVPPAVVQNFQHIVSPQKYTKLDADAASSDTSITVNDTSEFPSKGELRINDEFILYTGKTATTFTGLSRGYDCLSNSPFCDGANAHSEDDIVYNETTVRKPKYSVYAVDGPVVAKDIYTDGTWKTIAIAGFGKGGRGYTALDVTNTDNPIHMFTILNDIQGPGLARAIKVWQTTYNSASSFYETKLTNYDYTLGIETTTLSAAVTAIETANIPVTDASKLASAGYVTVTNSDGTNEIIYYGNQSGNRLQDLTRSEDTNGNSNAIALESGASVSQDSTCTVASTNVPKEYDYTRLGLTTSMPSIINIKVNGAKKWVAVFGGGQNYGKDCTTGNAVYVMDLEDNPGTIVKQIVIPDDPTNSINNTVNANLAVIQRDGTTKANYYGALVYVADLENKLWKIDLTENAGSQFGRKIKLFEDVATDTNSRRNYQEILPILDSSQNVPITGSSVESNILRLYWGTGDMDNLAERTNQVLNRLYGISDMTFMNFGLTWQTADDLTNTTALYAAGDCKNTTSLGATCPALSNVNPGKNIGWYIDLPNSRKVTGRKVLYDKEQVYFVLYEPTTKLCSPGDAIIGTYGYMCPNYKRLVIALGAGLGTGATTQGSQIYIGVSNAGTIGTYKRGDILEQAGSGFSVSGSAASVAQDIKNNPKGTDSIIVLSPVGTSSTGSSSIDGWRHYSGENYFDH